MILEKDVSPGNSYEGKIIVENISDKPHEIKAFQKDYFFDISNGAKVENAGVLTRSNAKWIAFSPDFTTIPANGSIAIKYSVKVPDSTGSNAVTGSYWSLLMIEEVPDKSVESKKTSNDREIRIIRTVQYGVQLITTIEHAGTKKIDFLRTQLSVNDTTGQKSLLVDLKNSGNLTFRPKLYLEIYNSKGLKTGTYHGESYLMHPGTSVRNKIDISTLLQGSYTALLVADGGSGALFGVQLKLNL